MADQRRFDTLEQTAARTAQQLTEDTSTIYGRLATHTHPENAPAVHTHPGSYALYTPSGNQSLPAGNVTTVLEFGVLQLSSSKVSQAVSGAGHTFTLGDGGIWMVHVFCRVNSGGSVGFTNLNIATSAYRHATALAAETTNGHSILSQTALILASSGDTVTASIYHERGAQLTTTGAQTGIRIARVATL